jgi:hypothetical protein
MKNTLQTAKKTWKQPVIKVIDLNSARNGVVQHGDGPGTGKS